MPTYQCDAVITTTEIARRALERLLDRLLQELNALTGVRLSRGFQVRVIPRGVPAGVFRPRDRAGVRRDLELPADKVILLYTGRIDPSSKMDAVPLLLALRKLVVRHADRVVLVLAGLVGPEAANLFEVIHQLGLSRHVILRTNLPYVSIPLYYSAADIFVSLSDTLQENFGLTPVEAMASGLPVVVADWAGYRETVVHGKTGFKVRTTWMQCDEDLSLLSPFYDWADDGFYAAQSLAVDVDETASYLDMLVAEPELRYQMGVDARQHVLANFTLQRCAEMHGRLWHELSEVADQLPAPGSGPVGLMRPRYYSDFHGFASQLLADSARIQLTDRGRLVCLGREELFMTDHPRHLLSPDLLRRILRVIRLWSNIMQPISIEGLVGLLDKRNIDCSVTRRHVMWLLKYDLVRPLTR